MILMEESNDQGDENEGKNQEKTRKRKQKRGIKL